MLFFFSCITFVCIPIVHFEKMEGKVTRAPDKNTLWYLVASVLYSEFKSYSCSFSCLSFFRLIKSSQYINIEPRCNQQQYCKTVHLPSLSHFSGFPVSCFHTWILTILLLVFMFFLSFLNLAFHFSCSFPVFIVFHYHLFVHSFQPSFLDSCLHSFIFFNFFLLFYFLPSFLSCFFLLWCPSVYSTLRNQTSFFPLFLSYFPSFYLVHFLPSLPTISFSFFSIFFYASEQQKPLSVVHI